MLYSTHSKTFTLFDDFSRDLGDTEVSAFSFLFPFFFKHINQTCIQLEENLICFYDTWTGSGLFLLRGQGFLAGSPGAPVFPPTSL